MLDTNGEHHHGYKERASNNELIIGNRGTVFSLVFGLDEGQDLKDKIPDRKQHKN